MSKAKMLRRSSFLLWLCLATVFGLVASVEPAVVAAPEALDQIVLNLAAQQVVGHALEAPAQILLLDENQNLITNYDLAADPLTVTSSSGLLVPSLLNDPAHISGGIVDLLAAGIVYQGESGEVLVTASSTGLSSAAVPVSFSGYDILSATDVFGQPVDTLYADVGARLRVVVTNGGNLTAIVSPRLQAFFVSGGGARQVIFSPGSDGQTDTLELALPTAALPLGADTLVLVLESNYQPGSSVLVVTDTVTIPIEVLATASIAIVPDSFEPESVYPGIPFDLAFDVATANLDRPLDSGNLRVEMLSVSDSVVAVLFDGPASLTSQAVDLIKYAGLSARLDAAGLAAGWYQVRLDLELGVGASLLTLDDEAEEDVDSIQILPTDLLTYVSASLQPTLVSSGSQVLFSFKINLSGTEAVQLDDASVFTLTGASFSRSFGLNASGNSLMPGENTVETEYLLIPDDQLGQSLAASLSLVYAHAGAAGSLIFTSDFEGQPVEVESLPVLKVVQSIIEAPNAPYVNTNQACSISCLITNTSALDMPAFEAHLMQDGSSLIVDDTQPVAGIASGDTVLVRFNIVASADVSDELFELEIANVAVHVLPGNNGVTAHIQRHATLAVSLNWPNVNQGSVSAGSDFSLILGIASAGSIDGVPEAAASDGRFRISTGDVHFWLPDTARSREELIEVDGLPPRLVWFKAPEFDTLTTILVSLIELPIDLNTGLPAHIGMTSFAKDIVILASEPVLEISASVAGAAIVYPDKEKDLLVLHLHNPGASSVADIRLDSLVLGFTDDLRRPVAAASVVRVGSVGLYDGESKLAEAVAAADSLRLHLTTEYVIGAGSSADLIVRGITITEPGVEFGLTLKEDGLFASLARGPVAGLSVTIAAADTTVIEGVFTTVQQSLAGSLIIKDNPFDPNQGPAEFRYFLAQDEEVSIRILTLTGELVLDVAFAGGSAGAQAGENSFLWEGSNDRGYQVVNGVYLVVVTTSISGERAALKVAVVK